MMRRQTTILCWLLTSFILVILQSGCKKDAKEAEAATAVQVEPASQGPITEVVTVDAVIYPLEQAAISPKITAPVTKFYIHPGSYVHAGELLAQLENKDLEGVALDNKGQFALAEATYATAIASSIPEEEQKAEDDTNIAKGNLDAQQKVYDARQDLFKKGALPRRDLDQASVALLQAKSQYELAARHLDAVRKVNHEQSLKAASGQLSSAKGKYLNAEAQLSYSEVRSPINGRITQRTLYPGEVAQAGTPFITVVNNSQIIAKAHIPQNEAVLIKPGDPATISVPGLDDAQGKVSFVNSATDPNSSTIEVWVNAKNPNESIKPGLTGSVTITARTVKDAVLIPANALQPSGEGGFAVMVAGSDDKAHQKKVSVGVRNASQVQITEGIKAGDPVIVAGGFGLADNGDIKVGGDKDEKGGDKDEKGPEKADKKEDEADSATAKTDKAKKE
jgi:HlyD family secretion protein